MLKEETFAGASGEDVLRYEESALYEEKIRRLEDSISSLRISRRILMSLLEQVQDSYRMENDRLAQENSRLRRKLIMLTREFWRQNGVRSAEEKGATTQREILEVDQG